jgi:catecholate siderophore receptor
MQLKRIRLLGPVLMIEALCLLMVARGTLAEEPAGRQAHDSDLDNVLITGSRTVGLPQLTQPVLDTPQTITTIPEEVIQLQADTDLRDVLRNDPSISSHADEDNAQGTNVTIRGFSARYDVYLDGQLDIGPYYRDPFYMESVEVLTGPSSVLFGRGSTGGVIEQNSKKPLLDNFVDGTANLGTNGLKRLTGDVNTLLSSDANAAFRLAGMAQESGIAGRDVVTNRRVGFAPSVSFGINEPTQFTLSDLFQEQWDNPDYGVPWIDLGSPKVDLSRPAQVSPDNFYGFRSDFSRVTVNIATAALRSQLADGLVLKNQLRWAVYNQTYREAEPGIGAVFAPGTALSSITVTRTERGGRAHQQVADDLLTLNHTFHIFDLLNTAVYGLEVGRQTSDPTVLKFSGVPATNLVNPNENQGFSGTSVPGSIVQFVANTAAAFVTDTLALGDYWEVNGAARWDRFAANYENQVPKPVTLAHTDTKVSGRGALVFKPVHAVSAYAMYGSSFDPSAEGLSLSASTADLAPEQAHTVETGVKWDPNSHLLVSTALFKTVMSNLREASPTNPALQILAGTARSEGVDTQAQGYLTPNWLTLAGVTYMNASILSSPNGDRGSQLQNAPRVNVRLFSAYDFTSRLTVGGSFNYTSTRVPGTLVDGNGFWQQAPAYWTASALARYRVADRMNVQLNVDNIADRRYYDGLDDNHVNISTGRAAVLSLIVER